ncbi:hypothetical protein NQZ68_017757 [Dissostichus eleginoides]|nr:hypothetical protein NQZ68_017757 [Dissostichus eleginoides]
MTLARRLNPRERLCARSREAMRSLARGYALARERERQPSCSLAGVSASLARGVLSERLDSDVNAYIFFISGHYDNTIRSAGISAAGTTPEPHTEPETTCLKSLPLLSSPTAARTGPVKTGGRVFVLDHKRWTGPMKQAVDNLLNKHHGQKDMLKLVDKDYAALVLDSCTDPNSMLHPTTKHHICQYVKHLSKLLNTSSSINISPEKLQERQVLWHSLTEGSETTSVPVVTMPVAVFNPTPPVQTPATPLTLEHVENFPKARFENDGSSIHHFYMQGTVRYFYCSTNVFITYGAEGLTDPKMPFGDFAETAFFSRELEAMKQRVEARVQQKRKNAEPEHKGRKCGFCRMELKQGPNSPHIHTGFPGVAGKYVYCPAKVLSLYRDQGMEKQMTWKNFKESVFYEAEKGK